MNPDISDAGTATGTVARYEFGTIAIDGAARQVWRDGEAVVVPSKAFDILIYLAARPDRTISKDELIGAVWKNMFVSEDSLVHSMSVLRRALGDDSSNPQLIITVPRKGYRLRGPVRADTEAPLDHFRSADAAADAPVVLRPPATRWPTHWIILSLVALAALALLIREFVPHASGPRGEAIQLNLAVPEGMVAASGGILSPDSRYIIFAVRDRETARVRLHLKPMDSSELRPLGGTEGASDPFWAPTSDMIAFFANGKLEAVDLRGAVERTIASVPVTAGGGTWSRSGTILFSDSRNGLYQVDAAGGRVTPVTTVSQSSGEVEQKLPQFLPDGRHFLFFLRSMNDAQTGNYIGSLDGAERIRILGQVFSPAIYSSAGYLLYVQDDTLQAQRFDAARFKVDGKPAEVARHVSSPDRAEDTMISASGTLLTFRSGTNSQELAWFEPNGRPLGSISTLKDLRSPMFSPDEKRLVAVDGGLRIWTVDLKRNAATQLEGEGTYPLWSPDGSRIAFESPNHLTLFVRSMDLPAQQETVQNDKQRKILNDWSPLGNYLLFTTQSPGTNLDLVLLPLSGDKKPVPLLHTVFNESQGRIAPNGRWIAYVSDESGTQEVYVQRFPSLGYKRIVSIGGGVEPMWRQDGEALFYLSPDHTIVSVPFHPTEPPIIGEPKSLFRAPINTATTRNHYAVTSDGRFLINVEDQSSYLSPITVMVNWTVALGAK
jgi:DNA-binding winged helix-turn-helix (wHTH) protein/Tol biopolymer transport system component